MIATGSIPNKPVTRQTDGEPSRSTRREFLKTVAAGATVAATGTFRVAPGSCAASASDDREDGPFSFGLVTDVHYADIAPQGSRHYRDSLGKLAEAVGTFNARKPAFLVELGDFVDAGAAKDDDLKYLATIRKTFEAFHGPRHFVLGNHCVTKLTKEEFLDHCGAEVKRSYHSFDVGRYHFVVLDANFREDGAPYAAGNFQWTDAWIHGPQQEWLADDLQKARDRRTLVFVHQNLDKETDAHGVKNAPAIRAILEKAGNVLAVLQGHLHSGGYSKIAGIHYVTLRAMIEGPGPENNAFALATIDADDRITLQGFGRQVSYPGLA